MSDKPNRISKNILEFSENKEDWQEAFNEFIIAKPLKSNNVPVHGTYHCVCGAKIRHGRIWINKINKNKIYLGKKCQDYVINKIEDVINDDKKEKKNYYNSNPNVEHIKKCIVNEDNMEKSFICNFCYWILPKTHKQKGFTNKCIFCASLCKYCGGEKKCDVSKCNNCYLKEKGYKKCVSCNNYKLKPDTTFIKCYNCLIENKKPCSKCGKYKVNKNTGFKTCYDCNKILKSKK